MAKARILAVDDQRYFRAFLEDILRGEGYEVRSAESGEEALQYLESGSYDVIVTDVVMPGISGTDLVERVKAKSPDQEIIVVTGVGDVRTAVDAMRSGASDYLLKPLDPTLLARSLEAILQRRRLRHEHASLMAENLEYLGALSLYERSMALFSTYALGPLASRVLDGLCLELRAEGGAIWLAENAEAKCFALLATRGLPKDHDEPESLDLDALPQELHPLADSSTAPYIPPAPDPVLWVPFRDGETLLGLARISARKAARSYEDTDRGVAERFARPASIAIANALRHRSLEHRSFRDPVTQTYTAAYLNDFVDSEIRKAGRFGRIFSLLLLQHDGVTGGPGGDETRARIANHLARVLRGTDLVAALGDNRFGALLPETDALGATILKRRVREIFRPYEPDGADEDAIRVATVAFPFDGRERDALWHTLDRRLQEDAESVVRSAGLRGRPFPALLEALSQYGRFLAGDAFGSIARFLLSEVDRRAGERGVLGIAPSPAWVSAVRDGLARLDPASTRCEIVLVSDVRPEFVAGSPVTIVPPGRVGWRSPFLFYYTEGPAYAAVADTAKGAITGLWQSADRSFVEEIAFQLQKALGMSIGR